MVRKCFVGALVLCSLSSLAMAAPASMSRPHLIDFDGRVTIVGHPSAAEDKALMVRGATAILYDRGGHRVGVYVDNETPNRNVVARRMIKAKVGQVVVGVTWNEVGFRLPGAVCAMEWYPYHWIGDASHLPRAEAYILQFRFCWPTDKPPTTGEWLSLLATARAKHPTLIWGY